jgi:hypothetical protein
VALVVRAVAQALVLVDQVAAVALAARAAVCGNLAPAADQVEEVALAARAAVRALVVAWVEAREDRAVVEEERVQEEASVVAEEQVQEEASVVAEDLEGVAAVRAREPEPAVEREGRRRASG